MWSSIHGISRRCWCAQTAMITAYPRDSRASGCMGGVVGFRQNASFRGVLERITRMGCARWARKPDLIGKNREHTEMPVRKRVPRFRTGGFSQGEGTSFQKNPFSSFSFPNSTIFSNTICYAVGKQAGRRRITAAVASSSALALPFSRIFAASSPGGASGVGRASCRERV